MSSKAPIAGAQSAPPPLANNGYSIEIFQGPVLAPIHVIGVGGAYVASAEGTEGSAANAAAPAVRDSFSTTWFDYDVAAGATLPGAFAKTDFDNRGDFAPPSAYANAGDFIDVNVGGTVQFGLLGFALTGELQQYSLTSSVRTASALTMQIGQWKALGAYGFLDGQLAIGAGLRVLTLQIFQRGSGTLLTMTGLAPEVGALLMPKGLPWRLGMTARGQVSGGIFGSENVTVNSAGVRNAGSFVLPSEVDMPWELEVGAAYQLGPRPLNPGWQNPHDQEEAMRAEVRRARADRAQLAQAELSAAPPAQRAALAARIDARERAVRAAEDERIAAESQRLREIRKSRYANWPRERILLLASALITGPSPNAVSVEGFLDQSAEQVGRRVTVAPRFGIEGEPLRDRMLLRAGTYVEPSRYAGVTPRQHFTFGADVKLFTFNAWGLIADSNLKVMTVLDVAPRYTNTGIAIGLWH